jgi:hypothetical protein
MLASQSSEGLRRARVPDQQDERGGITQSSSSRTRTMCWLTVNLLIEQLCAQRHPYSTNNHGLPWPRGQDSCPAESATDFNRITVVSSYPYESYISSGRLVSPVLLVDGHSVDVHAALEPPLLIRDLDIIAAHLPLAHEAVFGKGPVLKTVGPPPLAGLVVPFVPELDCNLFSC